MMKITKTSIFTGKTHTMMVNATPEEFDRWHSGVVIQNAMPNATIEEREFILTGVTPEEWSDIFDNREEEN